MGNKKGCGQKKLAVNNEKLSKTGKLILKMCQFMSHFYHQCQLNSQVENLNSFDFTKMVKVQRSALLKTVKEQPVMAKQMVKNIQFDLLEKRKEIDYLGEVLVLFGIFLLVFLRTSYRKPNQKPF